MPGGREGEGDSGGGGGGGGGNEGDGDSGGGGGGGGGEGGGTGERTPAALSRLMGREPRVVPWYEGAVEEEPAA